MSENQKSQEWVDPQAWLDNLSIGLAEEYIVVAEPIIQRIPMSAIVVGSKGLVILHARNWQGEIVPSNDAPWRQQTPNGLAGSFPNPAADLRKADNALRRFLRDEFPALKLAIKQAIILYHPDATVSTRSSSFSGHVFNQQKMTSEVEALLNGMAGSEMDLATREKLAIALTERQLTRNQRAKTPFTFRSSSPLGGSHRAWTLKQLFRHLERNPKDAVYHMRNGTLEEWLNKEGALHIAKLVHDALGGNVKDPRISLEEMLAKSGLVTPRKVSVHPGRINMGRLLAGANYGQLLTVRSLNRHGYLVGNLETSAPWLRVEPKVITGGRCEVAVRVDTSRLAIQNAPYAGQVMITSPSLTKAIQIPVSVHVVSEPSRFIRVFIRPILGAVSAAIVGAMIGLGMANWGAPPPLWLRNFLSGWSVQAIWAVIFGLFWAIWGLVRGLQQPRILPTWRGIIRWILGSMLWMLPLGLIGLAVAWALGVIYATSTLFVPEVGGTIVSAALGLSIVPAVLDRDRSVPEDDVRSSDTLRSRRPVIVTAIAIVLAVAIFAGVMYLPAAWRSSQVQEPTTTAKGWVATQYETLRTRIDTWIKGYYMDRYDRRAPGQPTMAPTKPVQH